MKLLFATLLLAAVAHAVSTTGARVLAILDNVADKDSYTTFFGDLTDRGYQIDYLTPKSDGLNLFHLGERAYDHVVLFPVKAKGLGPNLTPQLLVKFLNDQGNFLVALDSRQSVPTAIVSLLSELDIVLPIERTARVVDHFSYDTLSSPELHDVVVASPRVFGDEDATPIAFPHAIGHVLGDSPLLQPVVNAPRTAYSYNPKEQPDTVTSSAADSDPNSDLFAAGAQLKLVSALQARNSARLVLLGAVELLADVWVDGKAQVQTPVDAKPVAVDNRGFARRLAAWAFQETGVLRVNWIEHYLDEEANLTNPKIYRVKNDVTYTISLSEYSWDHWIPFQVPKDDALQLEFSMLSPFHRLGLHPNPARSTDDSAAYTVSFTLPDQHGIFNFLVNYKRPFLTYLEEKITVSVRHMAHNEWPRSFVISSSWPWITGISVTIVGWIAFCGVWMYSQPASKTTVTKKTQ